MKIIKFLFLLIILALLGILVYQNQEYFLAATALHIDLKISGWQYTAQALPNVAFWGICFGLGLLITGIRGMFTAFRLGREIKAKDAQIAQMESEMRVLKTDLEVFTHDPYIKNQVEKAKADAQDTTTDNTSAEPVAEDKPAEEPDTSQDEKADSAEDNQAPKEGETKA